jgi:hypothetical protein
MELRKICDVHYDSLIEGSRKMKLCRHEKYTDGNLAQERIIAILTFSV